MVGDGRSQHKHKILKQTRPAVLSPVTLLLFHALMIHLLLRFYGQETFLPGFYLVLINAKSKCMVVFFMSGRRLSVGVQ